MRIEQWVAMVVVALCLVGCSGKSAAPTAGDSGPHALATDIDPQMAQADYWWGKGVVAQVESGDFQRLWDASRQALVDDLFILDRTDFRGGVMTSRPMVSKQIFEFWRSDTVKAKDQVENTLATIRRTVRMEFVKTAGGGYQVAPKVLVERYALPEHRVTSVVQYRSAFIPSAGAVGYTSDTDPHARRPYWYAIGRDSDLENRLAAAVKKNL